MSKYRNYKKDNRKEFKNADRVVEILNGLQAESANQAEAKSKAKSKEERRQKRKQQKQADQSKAGIPAPTEQVQQAEAEQEQPKPTPKSKEITQAEAERRVVICHGLVDYNAGAKPVIRPTIQASAIDDSPVFVAFTISHGPIWPQLILALQNPFYRENEREGIVEEVISPETVTFTVRRRVFRTPDCDPASLCDMSEEFSLTTTIESINHRKSQNLLVLKGRIVNIMGISQNHVVEIFYRTDARCGAVISSKTHITQKFHVPKNLGY